MSERFEQVGRMRDLLKHLIGQRLMEITEQDDDWEGDPFIDLMFENAQSVRFFIADADAYKGFPISFSDPDPEHDDYFHPEEADTAARKWAAVVEVMELGEILHVIPCFGKLHMISEHCHCSPKKEYRDDDSHFFNHNEVSE